MLQTLPLMARGVEAKITVHGSPVQTFREPVARMKVEKFGRMAEQISKQLMLVFSQSLKAESMYSDAILKDVMQAFGHKIQDRQLMTTFLPSVHYVTPTRIPLWLYGNEEISTQIDNSLYPASALNFHPELKVVCELIATPTKDERNDHIALNMAGGPENFFLSYPFDVSTSRRDINIGSSMYVENCVPDITLIICGKPLPPQYVRTFQYMHTNNTCVSIRTERIRVSVYAHKEYVC